MLKSVRRIMVLLVVFMLVFVTTTFAAGEKNLAPQATVTASSSFAPEYDVALVIDGIKSEFGKGEWASLGETEPWVQLEWKTPVTLTKIVLYDRENTLDNAMGGTITFSDGSTIEVTEIDKLKVPKEVAFDAKTVTSLKFQIKGEGANVGLSEIEAFGTVAEAAASAETNSSSNPNTGDAGMLFYMLTAGAAGAGVLLAKKKNR